jgi:hypothetical protein
MKYIVFIILFFCAIDSSSQVYSNGDTLQVVFKKDSGARNVQKQSDLDYAIEIKNISKRSIDVYSKLQLGGCQYMLTNYGCQLEKKEITGYVFIPGWSTFSLERWISDSLFHIYGFKYDSVMDRFDINKQPLLSGQTRVLKFNVLSNYTILAKGEYRFKVCLRSRTIYDGDKLAGIESLESDWYYFSLSEDIYSSSYVPNDGKQ